MTDKERSALERAIERAGKLGLEVVGHGRRRADNAPVHLVPSATEPNHCHLVLRFGSRLVCDCTAGQYDRICVHRAAVYVYLFNQAARRHRLAEDVEQAMREEREEQALHEATARLEHAHRRVDASDWDARESPRLADNRAPVGMWK